MLFKSAVLSGFIAPVNSGVLYKNKDNSTNEDWKIVADLIKTI